MWQVKIEDEAAEVFNGSDLTAEDKIVIQKWAETVVEHGPDELQKYPSIWADHPLYEERKGHTASSFSYKGRIIYRVKEKVVTVIVVRITADHDYKKKEE